MKNKDERNFTNTQVKIILAMQLIIIAIIIAGILTEQIELAIQILISLIIAVIVFKLCTTIRKVCISYLNKHK